MSPMSLGISIGGKGRGFSSSLGFSLGMVGVGRLGLSRLPAQGEGYVRYFVLSYFFGVVSSFCVERTVSMSLGVTERSYEPLFGIANSG